MDNKLLVVSAGLMIIALVSVPVMAVPPADTGTPFNQILSIVGDIQIQVDSVLPIVTDIQTNVGTLTDLPSQLTSWFGSGGEYQKVEKMVDGWGTVGVKDSDPILIIGAAGSDPVFKVTLTVQSHDIDPGEIFRIYHDINRNALEGRAFVLTEDTPETTYEFLCNRFILDAYEPGNGMYISYSYVISYDGEEPPVLVKKLS